VSCNHPDHQTPTFAEADPAARTGSRITSLNVPAPELVEWLIAKGPGDAQDLLTRTGAETYARSFLVSGLVKGQILDTVHSALIKAFADGFDKDGFVDAVTPALREAGFLGGDGEAIGDRLRLVFDTNLSQAQQSARWQRLWAGRRYAPYLRYAAVIDGRERDTHGAMHGVIRPIDDPVWQTWFPQNGFRCRCICIGVTERQLERYGGLTAVLPNVLPDPGWGFNPGLFPIEGARAGYVGLGTVPGLPVADTNAIAAKGVARWLNVFSAVSGLGALLTGNSQ
jgi:SPP1 gp7 family putative phage head morphogenesis protein